MRVKKNEPGISTEAWILSGIKILVEKIAQCVVKIVVAEGF